MSDQTAHPEPASGTATSASELDAAVDTLVSEVAAAPVPKPEVQAEPARPKRAPYGLSPVSAGAQDGIDERPLPKRGTGVAGENAPAGAPVEKLALAAAAGAAVAAAGSDPLLGEISQDIERAAPGPLPVPPPPAPKGSRRADKGPGFSTGPSFEPVPELEPTAATPARASRAQIEQLDEALAASAESVLSAAQLELQSVEPVDVVAKPTPPPPAPAALTAPAAKPVEPAKGLTAKTDAASGAAPAKAAAEPAKVGHESVKHEPAPATEAPAPSVPPAPTMGERIAPLVDAIKAVLEPVLRPLTELHGRFSDSTKQIIGLSAVVTLFFGAIVWGKVVLFPSGRTLEPTTAEREFYDDTKPAHGVKSPPKKEAAKSEHGESGGHGEAKKAEPKHAEPKKDAGHGAEQKGAKKEAAGHGDGHGEKKAPPAAKPAAKGDGHGGH